MTPRPDAKEIAAARKSFLHAWRRLGAHSAPNFAEIVERYSEPHRAYHTLEHILECLRWLAATRELAECPFEVELALIYHDVVYDPRRSDNEQRSAEMFRAHAHASQLPDASTERIAALIEGTASHRAREGDGALVNDIDLAVLGASPPVYAAYEARIRQEYRHVDETLFRLGRARILRSFLESASIYATPLFRQRFETQARTNLSRSLAVLRATDRKQRA